MIVAVIPAFNEEKTIAQVVSSVLKQVDFVVVVDDGSSDSTASLAHQAGAHTLIHALNRGQGAALQTGQEYAYELGADYVVHFDADGQFDEEEIPLALEALQKSGAHVLFGSRFLQKEGNLPLTKKYIMHPLAKGVNFVFGTPKMSDVHNGFRILNKKALERIQIGQDRMAHATEIPVRVKEEGLAFIEFPVTVRYFEYGQNFKGGIRILKDLIIGGFIR